MLNREIQHQLEQAKNDLEQGEADKAISLANDVITENPGYIEAYLLRAKGKRKKQDFGGALNDYHKVLELDPENQSAKTCIKMIDDILYIQNNHFFADPYTDEDHIEGL